MGWAQGFESGSRAMGGIIDTYLQAKQRRELEDITNAKEQDVMGSRDATADEIERARAETAALAAQDAQEFGLDKPMGFNLGRQVIEKTGVSFLGKNYDKPLTDDQKSSARMLAMAGVVKKSNPMEGLRIEQQARQGERDDQRFGWEQKRAVREEDAAQREEAWRKGRDELFQGSHFGQIQRANSEATSKYEADLADYNRRLQAGETGLTAPVRPEAKTYGYGQSLLDHLSLAAHDVQYGKAGAETLSKLAQMQKAFADEGYAKALKLAQGGAPIAEVAKVFNASGNAKFDPADVVSDKIVDMGNGLKSRVLSVRGADGNITTIDTLSELDALDKADKLIDRVFKTNADTRADKALGLQERQTNASVAHTIAQTGVLNQTLTDKKELSDIRTSLNQAIDSGDEAAIKAGRAKLLGYMMSGKSGMQQMSPEERKANFYLASGMAPTMADAARMAHEKVQTSAKDDYMALMKPNSMGMVPSAEQIEPIMSAMHGQDWKAKLAGPKAPAAKPKDQADAHAQAQAAMAKGASKEAVNQRLKQLGYAPLP